MPDALPFDEAIRPNAGDSTSPLVRALLDYERQFCLMHAQGRAIYECGGARITASTVRTSEQAVQGAALRSAVKNLRGFSQVLSKRYTAFQDRYAEAIPIQAQLARTFEADVEVPTAGNPSTLTRPKPKPSQAKPLSLALPSPAQPSSAKQSKAKPSQAQPSPANPSSAEPSSAPRPT